MNAPNLCRGCGQWPQNCTCPVPPAEPDSGIREQKPGLKNKKMLAAIHTVIIEHSGNGLLADEVCNFLAWKPDAPADHVEHVRRKARQLIAALESFGWVVLADDKHATQRKALEQVIEQIFRELLSSHRSNSPASVSAAPDSAYAVPDLDERKLRFAHLLRNKFNIKSQVAAHIACDFHAVLLDVLSSAPRSSEVSGVAAEKAFFAWKCSHFNKGENDDYNGIDPDPLHCAFMAGVALAAPSAPSSTEQKGT